jgi:hypothetical protein
MSLESELVIAHTPELRIPVKFYHASSHRLQHGTFLTPGEGTWFKQLGHYGVFLTTSPVPHYTLTERIEESKKPWHVYEVEPLGKVRYGAVWDDIIAEQARAIRYVGNAKGIFLNRQKRFTKKDNEKDDSGSAVRPNIKPHGIKIRMRGNYYVAIGAYK